MTKPSRKPKKNDVQIGITPQAMGDLLRLGITPPALPLVTPDPAEENVVICDQHGYFPDDVHGHCERCGAEIAWRPHNPAFLVKLCMACGLASLKEEEQAKD